MTTFSLSLPKERLDLPLCVGCGQVFRWQTFDGDQDRWVGVDGDHWYDVRIEAHGECVQYDIVTNGDQDSFERLFRLDVDERSAIDAILRAEPALLAYVRGLPGLRLMRPSQPVEEAFCFLCTPNNHLVRITQMVRSLGSFGVPFDDCRVGLAKFPSLEAIAELPEAELRDRGFGYRARTIPSIARQIVERGGTEWFERLKDVPYAEAHSSLLKIAGIGPKLADCICLFALHHDEAVPVDTHLWQAAVRLYFPEWRGKALTHQRYRAVGEAFRSRFGELSGWAHQYLFYDNLLHWRERRGNDHG